MFEFYNEPDYYLDEGKIRSGWYSAEGFLKSNARAKFYETRNKFRNSKMPDSDKTYFQSHREHYWARRRIKEIRNKMKADPGNYDPKQIQSIEDAYKKIKADDKNDSEYKQYTRRIVMKKNEIKDYLQRKYKKGLTPYNYSRIWSKLIEIYTNENERLYDLLSHGKYGDEIVETEKNILGELPDDPNKITNEMVEREEKMEPEQIVAFNNAKAEVMRKYHEKYKSQIREWKLDSQNFVLNNLWRIKPTTDPEDGYEADAISEIAEGLEEIFKHYFIQSMPDKPEKEKPKEKESQKDKEERLARDQENEKEWKEEVVRTKQLNKEIINEAERRAVAFKSEVIPHYVGDTAEKEVEIADMNYFYNYELSDYERQLFDSMPISYKRKLRANLNDLFKIDNIFAKWDSLSNNQKKAIIEKDAKELAQKSAADQPWDDELAEDEADFKNFFQNTKNLDSNKDENSKKFKTREKLRLKALKEAPPSQSMVPITFEGKTFFTPAQQNAIMLMDDDKRKKFLKDAKEARKEGANNKEKAEISQKFFKDSGIQPVEKLPDYMDLYRRVANMNVNIDRALPSREDPRPRPQLAVSTTNSLNINAATTPRKRRDDSSSADSDSPEGLRRSLHPPPPVPTRPRLSIGNPTGFNLQTVPVEDPRPRQRLSMITTNSLDINRVSSGSSRKITPVQSESESESSDYAKKIYHEDDVQYNPDEMNIFTDLFGNKIQIGPGIVNGEKVFIKKYMNRDENSLYYAKKISTLIPKVAVSSPSESEYSFESDHAPIDTNIWSSDSDDQQWYPALDDQVDFDPENIESVMFNGQRMDIVRGVYLPLNREGWIRIYPDGTKVYAQNYMYTPEKPPRKSPLFASKPPSSSESDVFSETEAAYMLTPHNSDIEDSIPDQVNLSDLKDIRISLNRIDEKNGVIPARYKGFEGYIQRNGNGNYTWSRKVVYTKGPINQFFLLKEYKQTPRPNEEERLAAKYQKISKKVPNAQSKMIQNVNEKVASIVANRNRKHEEDLQRNILEHPEIYRNNYQKNWKQNTVLPVHKSKEAFNGKFVAGDTIQPVPVTINTNVSDLPYDGTFVVNSAGTVYTTPTVSRPFNGISEIAKKRNEIAAVQTSMLPPGSQGTPSTNAQPIVININTNTPRTDPIFSTPTSPSSSSSTSMPPSSTTSTITSSSTSTGTSDSEENPPPNRATIGTGPNTPMRRNVATGRNEQVSPIRKYVENMTVGAAEDVMRDKMKEVINDGFDAGKTLSSAMASVAQNLYGPETIGYTLGTLAQQLNENWFTRGLSYPVAGAGIWWQVRETLKKIKKLNKKNKMDNLNEAKEWNYENFNSHVALNQLRNVFSNVHKRKLYDNLKKAYEKRSYNSRYDTILATNNRAMHNARREAIETQKYVDDQMYANYRWGKERQRKANEKAAAEKEPQVFTNTIPLAKVAEEFDGPLKGALKLADYIDRRGPNYNPKTTADELYNDEALAESIFDRGLNAANYTLNYNPQVTETDLQELDKILGDPDYMKFVHTIGPTPWSYPEEHRYMESKHQLKASKRAAVLETGIAAVSNIMEAVKPFVGEGTQKIMKIVDDYLKKNYPHFQKQMKDFVYADVKHQVDALEDADKRAKNRYDANMEWNRKVLNKANDVFGVISEAQAKDFSHFLPASSDFYKKYGKESSEYLKDWIDFLHKQGARHEWPKFISQEEDLQTEKKLIPKTDGQRYMLQALKSIASTQGKIEKEEDIDDYLKTRMYFQREFDKDWFDHNSLEAGDWRRLVGKAFLDKDLEAHNTLYGRGIYHFKDLEDRLSVVQEKALLDKIDPSQMQAFMNPLMLLPRDQFDKEVVTPVAEEKRKRNIDAGLNIGTLAYQTYKAFKNISKLGGDYNRDRVVSAIGQLRTDEQGSLARFRKRLIKKDLIEEFGTNQIAPKSFFGLPDEAMLADTRRNHYISNLHQVLGYNGWGSHEESEGLFQDPKFIASITDEEGNLLTSAKAHVKPKEQAYIKRKLAESMKAAKNYWIELQLKKNASPRAKWYDGPEHNAEESDTSKRSVPEKEREFIENYVNNKLPTYDNEKQWPLVSRYRADQKAAIIYGYHVYGTPFTEVLDGMDDLRMIRPEKFHEIGRAITNTDKIKKYGLNTRAGRNKYGTDIFTDETALQAKVLDNFQRMREYSSPAYLVDLMYKTPFGLNYITNRDEGYYDEDKLNKDAEKYYYKSPAPYDSNNPNHREVLSKIRTEDFAPPGQAAISVHMPNVVLLTRKGANGKISRMVHWRNGKEKYMMEYPVNDATVPKREVSTAIAARNLRLPTIDVDPDVVKGVRYQTASQSEIITDQISRLNPTSDDYVTKARRIEQADKNLARLRVIQQAQGIRRAQDTSDLDAVRNVIELKVSNMSAEKDVETPAGSPWNLRPYHFLQKLGGGSAKKGAIGLGAIGLATLEVANALTRKPSNKAKAPNLSDANVSPAPPPSKPARNAFTSSNAVANYEPPAAPFEPPDNVEPKINAEPVEYTEV